jgi:arylsulfatase A-like enzyme
MKNIVLLFADDMRYGMIDNPDVITPNLERLAAKGIMYQNAHIPGGTSGAVCMPSRAMLHTGRLLEGLARAGRFIPDEHRLLGEVLTENGYETHGIGKWHNGTDSYARSFTSGAEIFFGGMDDHWNVPANNFDPSGKYDKKILKSRNPYNTNETMEYSCDHITPGKHSSELFADASIDFIENRNKKKPFFLYTAFMAPHDPRTMPKEFLAMYEMEKTKLPENYLPVHPFDFAGFDTRDERLAPYPRTEETVKQHLTEYYAMITHLDHCIGQILDKLESENLMDDTLIIFAADNGLAVGCHGLFGKQNLYEHSIRVPLVISGPGVPKNEKRVEPVYIADIFPTILDYLDISIPDTCQTKSLTETFTKETKIRNSLNLRYRNHIAGLKKDGFKLIAYFLEKETKYSLFNLKDDPDELRDLADDPLYKSVREKFQLELHENWKHLEL